jgi:hypothetical protein
MMRQGTVVFGDELLDLLQFIRRQFFNLLNDFRRAHILIPSRQARRMNYSNPLPEPHRPQLDRNYYSID